MDADSPPAPSDASYTTYLQEKDTDHGAWPMRIMKDFFSCSGRISRRTFAIRFAILALPSIVLAFPIASLFLHSGAEGAVFWLVWFLMALPIFCKRLHDTGKGGDWMMFPAGFIGCMFFNSLVVVPHMIKSIERGESVGDSSPGWFVILMLFFGVAALITIGIAFFQPGKRGSNNFGPPTDGLETTQENTPSLDAPSPKTSAIVTPLTPSQTAIAKDVNTPPVQSTAAESDLYTESFKRLADPNRTNRVIGFVGVFTLLILLLAWIAHKNDPRKDPNKHANNQQAEADENYPSIPSLYYENGKKQGREIVFDENGNKKSQTDFKDDEPHGIVITWYENGQKKEESNWIDGKQHGKATSWYENGQKESEASWQNGKGDGLAVKWFKNGEKQSETPYKYGEVHGTATFWFEDGKKDQINFSEGKQHGLLTMWDEDGNMIRQIRYENGKEVEIVK